MAGSGSVFFSPGPAPLISRLSTSVVDPDTHGSGSGIIVPDPDLA